MLVPVPVKDVATAEVETVDPGVTVRAAARQLRTAAVGSLVVVDDAGDPTGILTETDLVSVVAGDGDPDETTVEAVMSTPLVTVASDATLNEAARLFEESDRKKLPVLDDGELVGIVTTTDVSHYLPRLRNPGAPVDPNADGRQVRRNVRPETAYERPEWQFEYVGTDAGADGVAVGDSVRFSKPLSDDDVRAFADVTGDTNRLHLDDAFAAETRFGGRIVHGSLSTGVISAALARLPGLTIYLSKELQFLGPVGIGDRVVADCSVVENLGGGRFRLESNVGIVPEDAVDADADPSVPSVDEEAAVVSGSVTVLVDDAPDVGRPDDAAAARSE